MSRSGQRDNAAPRNTWIEGSDALAISEASPTVSLTAYTSGDVVGSVMEFQNVALQPGDSIEIVSLKVFDSGGQGPTCSFLLFDQDPTTTATVVDNAAFAWGTSAPNCIGLLTVSSWTTLASQRIVHLSSQNRVVKTRTTSVWAVLVTTSTPTFTAVDQLKLTLGVRQI